jgi:predicted nucleic acid-binding protein
MAVQVYLDTSVYNRPFDDQTQPRIWLESLAFSVILQMIEARKILLITSSVLTYENSRNPHELRRNWVERTIGLTGYHQLVDQEIKKRGEQLERNGLKALDALHIACAEAASANYFVTCDDRLIRRYQSLPQPRLKACDPTEAVRILAGE